MGGKNGSDEVASHAHGPGFPHGVIIRRNVSPALDFHDILLMPGQKRALERLSEPRLQNARSNGVKNRVWPSNGRFAFCRPQDSGARA